MPAGPNSPAAAEPPWFKRAGEACLRALAVVLLAAVPTALRTAGAGGSFPGGWLVGAGVLLPIVAAALILSRASGRGFHLLVQAEGPRAAVLRVALWVGIALPILEGLAAVLKATTHHRGIAGATFGVLGLVIVAGAALLAQRLVRLGRALVERGLAPWIPAAIGAAVSVLPLLVVAGTLGREPGSGAAAGVRAAILDGAIVFVATALAASMDLPPSLRKRAGFGGVPLAVVVFLGAGLLIESSPLLARAFKAGGGLPSTMLGVLEGWTDRDGDGFGSHFGGDDCDDGDPTRHPGAPEVAGDGIDQDCDGIDPVGAPRVVVSAAAAIDSAAPAAPVAGATAAPTAPEPVNGGKPDILLITLDTVRADHTSAYSYDKATTPHLAELAATGTLFAHAYATGSDTRRALAPLVSGRRFADTLHDTREWPTILPEVDTLAERLKRGGYRTGAVTSFTWLSQERGFSQGFDYFRPVFVGVHPERESTGPLAVKAALSILKELEKDPHPIFLWVHLFDAHERYLDHPGIRFGKGKAGLYDGEVAFVDEQVGELVAAVAASPRAAKTAWIVHGSQGEGLGEHEESGHGKEVYEEAIRVPLVVALPPGEAAKPGRYEAAAVSTLDLGATVVELAGAEATGLAGASLLPIVRGDSTHRHGPVYARTQKRAALIDWPLKLMVMERRKADRLFLFDLSKDPDEKNDLSKERAEDTARLGALRTPFEEKSAR
jgi:choline-sulfatase